MKKTITLAFIMIQLIVVSLLLFAAGSTDHYIKREQLYPNVLLMLAGIVLAVIVCSAVTFFRGSPAAWFAAHSGSVAVFTVLLFFFLSLCVCIGGFFYSDWDPAAILYGVYGILRGHPEDTGATYFSNHPNNLLLVWIYLLVLRFTGLFGIDSVLALVVFQCLLSSSGAFVFYRILKDMTDDPVTSYTGLLLYEIWVVLSPWFIITYSDEAGLIFPLLILRLYQRMTAKKGNNRQLITGGLMISALAAAGYFIKPQIIICFIAVILVFISDNKTRELRDRLTFLISCAAFTLIFVLLIKAVLIPSIGIKTDSSRSFGMAHYLMMGLNDETDGVYSDADTLYTDSFDTPEEKRKADLQLAKERLADYGAVGLIGHLKKKTLVNFNDGLFAWGVDGNFFAGRESEDFGTLQKTAMTGLIWRFIMPDGKDHGKYSSFLQMIWLTVLLLDLVCGIMTAVSLFRREDKTASCLTGSNVIFAVMLSLTGLFLFELLFEAKARYLFIYTPYYLMAAVCGAHAATLYITDRIKKTDLPYNANGTSVKD